MAAPKKQRRLVRRIFKGFAFSSVLGILGVAALFLALWLEHGTEVTLPEPTGTFAVGRALYDWSDDTLDTLGPAAGTKRELLVWIWYPAAAGQSPANDDYLPGALRTAIARNRGLLIGKLLTRDLSKVHAHGVWNAAVSPQHESYPVVIMRAGASGEVWNYTTLAEDLSSHGYVVAGFDAPYRTNVVAFPHGRVLRRLPQNSPELCLGIAGQEQTRCVSKLLTAWTTDIAFVLDRLAQLNTSDPSGKFHGRLDMERVGVFGHSLGGATALQFCHDDRRCKAGINLDGAPQGSVVQEGTHQPFLFLLTDHSSEPDSRQVLADLRSIYDRLPAEGRLFITIRGGSHFLFSDDGALLKSRIVLRALRTLGIVGIDGRRQLAVSAYCVRSFFDAYLKAGGVSPLKIASPLYPELQISE